MNGPAWPGYARWADTVAAAREEFDRTARAFGLIPGLIPPVDREDVALLYCFCRHLDDAVDEAPSPGAARAALDAIEAECDGRAEPRPLIAAFRAGAARSGLPLGCTRYLLDGMRSDLGLVRIPDDTAFLRYCYQVSAAVGQMLAPLLGIRDPVALTRAVDLGIGLQVSNILLGVRADAARDRVYLPAARLARHGLTPDDVLAGVPHGRLRPMLMDLARLGEAYYASAELAAWRTPLRYRHGILLLGRVYGGMGRAAARRADAPSTPDRVGVGMRVWRLIELAAIAIDPRILGLTEEPPHDPRLHTAIAGWPGANPAAGR
ncbi:MAG: squalene/phytoene synthase family protein [Gemmatimonadetes bacterium]|nr:squalene/phytoene synthase family protein [Gemmatimonadota bacterium]